MSSEYAAPAVKAQMRDMLGEAGRLLAPGQSVKAQLNSLSLYFRLPVGRLKRIWFDEVRTVEAGEFRLVNDWLISLRARLGTLESNYTQAREALLAEAQDAGDVAYLGAPAIGEDADRPVAPRHAGSRR